MWKLIYKSIAIYIFLSKSYFQFISCATHLNLESFYLLNEMVSALCNGKINQGHNRDNSSHSLAIMDKNVQFISIKLFSDKEIKIVNVHLFYCPFYFYSCAYFISVKITIFKLIFVKIYISWKNEEIWL